MAPKAPSCRARRDDSESPLESSRNALCPELWPKMCLRPSLAVTEGAVGAIASGSSRRFRTTKRELLRSHTSRDSTQNVLGVDSGRPIRLGSLSWFEWVASIRFWLASASILSIWLFRLGSYTQSSWCCKRNTPKSLWATCWRQLGHIR